MPGQGIAVSRLLVAAAVTGIAVMLSGLVWLLGQAQYLNDYCTSPRSHFSPPEASGGRPAYMDNPITVTCEYDGLPTVYVTEPLPLIGAVLLAGAVIAVASIAFSWARSSAR